MAGLPRSEMSFRRQGSSGLVWDDKLLSGELKRIDTGNNKKGDDPQERNRTTKAEPKSSAAYKTVDVEPSYDPPSPKVSGCGVCGMFGKPASKSQKKKHGHRRK